MLGADQTPFLPGAPGIQGLEPEKTTDWGRGGGRRSCWRNGEGTGFFPSSTDTSSKCQPPFCFLGPVSFTFSSTGPLSLPPVPPGVM